MKKKIIRAFTVPQSLDFIRGMLPELTEKYGVGVLTSPGNWEIVDRFNEANPGKAVRKIVVPMERRMAPMKDLRSLWRIYRALRRERPAMVHSMTPKAGLLCMMAGWMARVPVRVHMFTGLVFPTASGLTRRILMFTDRLTCACATHVIPEGEGVRRDLLENHITRKDIRVLGHGNCQGIDLERFDRTPEVMAEAEKLRRPHTFTFIAIGRMVGDKGINELVEAFVRLNAELPQTRLVLVGSMEADLDPLRPETLQTIQLHPAIDAVGRQADVRPWLTAADCHVLASYREGFPNVVIEAGAMGLPQIVTDINGANEIIIRGRNGLIIPPRDADALLATMRRIATEPGLAARLAAEARDLVATRYDARYVRRALLDFYSQILPK